MQLIAFQVERFDHVAQRHYRHWPPHFREIVRPMPQGDYALFHNLPDPHQTAVILFALSLG